MQTVFKFTSKKGKKFCSLIRLYIKTGKCLGSKTYKLQSVFTFTRINCKTGSSLIQLIARNMIQEMSTKIFEKGKHVSQVFFKAKQAVFGLETVCC